MLNMMTRLRWKRFAMPKAMQRIMQRTPVLFTTSQHVFSPLCIVASVSFFRLYNVVEMVLLLGIALCKLESQTKETAQPWHRQALFFNF